MITKRDYLTPLRQLKPDESTTFYKANKQAVRNAALQLFGIGGYTSKSNPLYMTVWRLK